MDAPDDLVPIPSQPWDERPTELPLDIEECRTALWVCKGSISDAAKLLKVGSARFRNFVNASEYLRRELQEASEVMADIAEKNIYEALTDPDDPGRRDTMSKWFLERKGRDRGYGNAGGVSSGSGPKGRITISWEGDSSPVIDGEAQVVNG